MIRSRGLVVGLAAVLAMHLLILVRAEATIAQDVIVLDYPYYYDPANGGLVDAETGLVWGWDVVTVFGWAGGTYDGANGSYADAYADTVWGYGYTDWRIPTKAELTDGAGKGVSAALVDAAAAIGLPEPYAVDNLFWSSDPKFKYRGRMSAWAVRLSNGEVRVLGTGSIIRIITVRQAW